MKRKEKEFLHAIALERIQQHYVEYQQEIQPDRARFRKLAEQYQEVMAHLSKADLKVVQDYQEYVFNSSAAVEMVLYKAGVRDGVRDGVRLAKLMKNI